MRAAPASKQKPTISAVVCTYSEERWDRLALAIESLQKQTYPLKEIIVVVDHNEPMTHRLRTAFPTVIVAANTGPQGLSGGRNTGAGLATGDILASLDDDARAAPDWSAKVAEDFADPSVVGVGSLVVAEWTGSRPSWFPEEFDWVVGCTYRGVPREKARIRNPLGAAMALRREVFAATGGYRTELGRLNKTPLGCEETELCIRITQQDRGAVFIQDPEAVATHLVTPERQTWNYFRRRCYAEGLSKAAVSRLTGASDALSAERSYVSKVLPAGVLRGLGSALKGDPSGLGRAAAIVAGLGFTAAGFLAGKWATRKAGPSRPASSSPAAGSPGTGDIDQALRSGPKQLPLGA